MMGNRGIAFKLIFSILSGCIIIFICIVAYNFYLSRKIVVGQIRENAGYLIHDTVTQIEKIMHSVEKTPISLANHLEHIPASCFREELLHQLLLSTVEQNPDIYGSTIAFEPYAFLSDDLYHAPYVFRQGDKTLLTYVGDESYHYFDMEWYRIPKEKRKPCWSEPYYDEGGGDVLMVTYSVPLFRGTGDRRDFIGVVTADIPLSRLTDIVSSVRIGKSGYAVLLSGKGTVLTSRRTEYIMKHTIFSIADLSGNTELRRVGQDMLEGKSGFILLDKSFLEQAYWMAYTPLPSLGWSLAVFYPREELIAELTQLKNDMIMMGTAGMFFLLLLIVFISGSITRPLRALAERTKDVARGNFDFSIPGVRSNDEVGKLARAFVSMRDELKQYIQDLKETTAANERMESELKIARDIQMGFLPPNQFPAFPERSDIDIFAYMEPAREVGGDLYDYFFIDEDRLCFVIGDVSGKGVPAALFMFRTLTLLRVSAGKNAGPSRMLTHVNREIAKNNEDCMFITVFCGILNLRTGELLYANAGHNLPILIKDTGKPELLPDNSGPALGISEDAVFSSDSLQMKKGETLFLYTDGISEAVNMQEQMFDEDRLIKVLSQCRQDSVRETVEKALAAVKAFSADAGQSDDITAMALRM